MEESVNADDAEHLSALSVGHFIMAGLSAVGAALAVPYAFAASKLVDQLGSQISTSLGDISGGADVDPFAGLPPDLMDNVSAGIVGLAVGSAVLSLATAVSFLLIGLRLRQRRWWTFCYLSGWGECLLFPFGTILGIFMIIVLSRPSVKRLFGMD